MYTAQLFLMQARDKVNGSASHACTKRTPTPPHHHHLDKKPYIQTQPGRRKLNVVKHMTMTGAEVRQKKKNEIINEFCIRS